MMVSPDHLDNTRHFNQNGTTKRILLLSVWDFSQANTRQKIIFVYYIVDSSIQSLKHLDIYKYM